MYALNPSSFVATRTFIGSQPMNGPKTLGVSLNFQAAGSNGGDIPVDLMFAEQEAWIDFVQSVFIDNTKSGQVFSLTAQITGQTLTINAGRQAYLPILAPPTAKFVASTNSLVAIGLVRLQLMNTPVFPIVW